MPEPGYVVLEDFAVEAAGYCAAQLNAAIRARGGAGLVLAGGGTPLALYKELAGPLAGDVPWAAVHFFWGDERLVPPDDPGSNYRAAWEALLSRAPVPAGNIHRVRGELSAAEAVTDYRRQLREWAAVRDPGAPNPWPRFDIVLLGLGEDGHTASLFPGSPVETDAPVIAVEADYQGRPAGRVSLTPRVFNDARQVFFLVSGANKAEAVAGALRSPVDPARRPAQRIRPHKGQVVWLLDEAAAASLN